MPLAILTRMVDPEITVVEFQGTLSITTLIDDVEARVTRLLAQGTNRVVFDFSRLDYVDSAGIGLVVFSYATVRDFGGTFRLAAPNARVKRVLAFTRLDSFLGIDSTLDEAIQNVQNIGRQEIVH